VLVVDIGVAQVLLKEPEQLSRLLVSPDAETTAPPLSSITGDQLLMVEPDEVSDLTRLTESFTSI
jgi:putative ABC transport system permease protein